MKSLDTLTHFCKLEYIESIWKKPIPKDYPEGTTSFSRRYDSEDERQAVLTMEENLATEESILADVVPETQFVSNYVGTYNVTGEPGEEVLLSPERVRTDDVVAMHYVEVDNQSGEWVQVEDAHVVDGYVYGTVESLSPIAIFEVKKEMEVIPAGTYLANTNAVVYLANGNPIRLYTEDNKYYMKNTASGKVIEITNPAVALVYGGCIDAGADNINIVAEPGFRCSGIVVGSASKSEQVTVKSAKLVAKGITVASITGSEGCVHTEELTIDVTDSKVTYFVGSGESITYLKSGTQDANAGLTPATVGLTSPFRTKKVNMNFKNTDVYLFYCGANTGMSYTHEANVKIDGGTFYYLILGASNGRTNKVTGDIKNVKADIFQTNNRGIVEDVKASIADSEITLCFVAGDNTDATVTGVTNKVALDLGNGSYKLIPGTQGGVEMTKDTNGAVEYVKYSRTATMTYAENTKDVLGAKLIMK